MDDIRRKSESRLMRFISLFTSADFMSNMWTTVGSTIYAPSCYDDDVDWGSRAWVMRHDPELVHERTHVDQYAHSSMPIFLLVYFGPAPLMVLVDAFLLGADLHSHVALHADVLGLVAMAMTVLSIPFTTGLAYGRWIIE